MRNVPPSLLGLLILATTTAFGDEFDRLEADRLQQITTSGDSKKHERLTINAIEALPQALRDARSAFLVVKTDQGNYARLLVSQALRKAPGGKGEALPVLILERFDTFEPGKASSRVAKGAGMVLFDGFQVDLDAGIIVPKNQGGDLLFSTKEAGGPTLKTLEGATLFTLSKPLPIEKTRPGPSPGKAIIPSDFAGRYRLFADGRRSGLLDLQLGEGRAIAGHFRSEEKGTTYEVKGEIAVDAPQKLVFILKFPQAEQAYEAYLWTEGKNALAGTFTMQGRKFGFVAIREGSELNAGK